MLSNRRNKLSGHLVATSLTSSAGWRTGGTAFVGLFLSDLTYLEKHT